jgi:hypothetical protein
VLSTSKEPPKTKNGYLPVKRTVSSSYLLRHNPASASEEAAAAALKNEVCKTGGKNIYKYIYVYLHAIIRYVLCTIQLMG